MHRSTQRVPQIAGADRELLLVAALLSILVMVLGWSVFALAVGLSFWFCSFWALRRMGKADPYMRQVVSRYLTYKSFYLAKSGLYAQLKSTGRWR
jgi:type IV secretion system protein TrbD